MLIEGLMANQQLATQLKAQFPGLRELMFFIGLVHFKSFLGFEVLTILQPFASVWLGHWQT